MSPRPETPLRCPIDGGMLRNVQVRSIGPVTGELTWELHAGYCPEHGWFQAEAISTPPREIFPVTRPGGTARTIEIGNRRIYAFPTFWDSVDWQTPAAMYDPYYWQVDWSRLPDKDEIKVVTP